ncbi:uncharacterized protein [Aegilops tauschii subsp. strangulata]|uniref:uncharacterized protein n=1 Tax=Aegilops tauschii subsp. strangulata TaxID=200361 RepID=UPI00098A8BE6|nr:uncharacterized protein LOC109786739 [Aegilops tauschii subsp. strangulata]
MAMSPPPPRRAPSSRPTPPLPDDVMREILLRLPADDPACLVRAAAGCISWRGMVSDPSFAPAYRLRRGAPPMLGFLYDDRPAGEHWISHFLPTATSPPLAARDRQHRHALDSRHGLALFYTPRSHAHFLVCDLVTGEHWEIRADPKCYKIIWSNLLQEMHSLRENEQISCNASVLCAKDGCDHRDCHGGPFLVALVGSDVEGDTYMNHAAVYSSATREWSDVTSVEQENVIDGTGHSAVVGNTVYAPCVEDDSVVVYNTREKKLSVIAAPLEVEDQEQQPYLDLMGLEDGMLLFASVVKPRLYLWTMEAGPRGAAGWARRRVIELGPLLPLPVLEDKSDVSAVGFAEGVCVIFLKTRVGLYTMELSPGKGKKVHRGYINKVMPYMSFYTGAWGRLPASNVASRAVVDATTI